MDGSVDGTTDPAGGVDPGAVAPNPSALPSVRARVLAFASILVAGVLGSMIGAGIVDLQCEGDCATAVGIGAVVGGVLAAVGVAVVAVLVMRAMGEWRRIELEREAGIRP